MTCQNCHEFIEPGASFCGNCGYPVPGQTPAPVAPVQTIPSSPPGQVEQTQPVTPQINQQPAIAATAVPAANGVPSYARTSPNQHIGETPALLAVIFGVIGIVGSGFLIPIIGLVFGVAGLCMGTVARRKAKRRLALIGLIIATLAIMAGFASLVWNIQHNKNSSKNAKTGQSTSVSKVLSKLATPCYSFDLVDKYNVSNGSGTCNTTIFNGQTFATSTDVYKIIATKAGTDNPGTFSQLAKQAINQDIQTNLPGFTITSQGPASFAGSLAYTVYASDTSQNTSVVETGVLHETKNGYNAFDILHAINGTNVNLQALEAQWQWQ